jgi:phosphoglycolate phosphatase
LLNPKVDGVALRAILFDKDGTLIDFDATWGPAAYEVMRALAGADDQAFAELVRVSEYVLEERRFLPTSPLVAGSSAHYGPLWAQALRRAPSLELYRQMDELFGFWGLRSLSPIGRPADLAKALVGRGLRVGIATNDAEASAKAQAEALGLLPHLDFIAGYDSGFGGKPHPGMVLAFAEHCAVRPDETALVGDSLHDLDAARAAGALRIAVLTGPLGHAARAELEPHADHVIAAIDDLPALLDEIVMRPGLAEVAKPEPRTADPRSTRPNRGSGVPTGTA